MRIGGERSRIGISLRSTTARRLETIRRLSASGHEPKMVMSMRNEIPSKIIQSGQRSWGEDLAFGIAGSLIWVCAPNIAQPLSTQDRSTCDNRIIYHTLQIQTRLMPFSAALPVISSPFDSAPCCSSLPISNHKPILSASAAETSR